jgi:hypothetical protein
MPVELMVKMSDEDLLARLRNSEDNFVERKTVSDLNDCVKTVVAFANSAPIGMPCVLYVGVKDDGTFEEKPIDFDSIQKSVNAKLKSIFPRVPYIAKVITDGTKEVLAVIVPGSELRPHFAGPSYIRVGSQSEEASQKQLDNLIAQHNSKVYRISQYIGKVVSVEFKFLHGNRTFTTGNWGNLLVKVSECNESWVTLTRSGDARTFSYPLNNVTLSYDDIKGQLMLQIEMIQG